MQHIFPGLDLYSYADPAQHITTAGQDLDYLDRDLSNVWNNGNKRTSSPTIFAHMFPIRFGFPWFVLSGNVYE